MQGDKLDIIISKLINIMISQLIISFETEMERYKVNISTNIYHY